MASFLTLCQAVARESGTFSNVGDPQTTSGQTGRLLRLTHWVNDAYAEIQREQAYWRWMMAEATGDMVIGETQYSGTDLGVSTRFGRWLPFSDGDDCEVSSWDATIGQSDEGFLRFMDWNEFRRIYRTGSNATRTGKPAVVSLAPDGRLAVYPTPDKAYKLRCQYRKSLQSLSGDSTVPEMPEEFHDAIKWKGLVLLGMFDEATQQKAEWQSKYGRVMNHLRTVQLPKMRLHGTLA